MISENEILNYITQYEKQLNDASFYVGNNIPEKKKRNAVKAYGSEAIAQVLALYDGTIFGSAKEGFMFTERSFFYHFVFDTWFVDYDDVDHFEIELGSYNPLDPKKDVLHIVTRTNDYGIDINTLDKRYLLSILENICGIDDDYNRGSLDFITEAEIRYRNVRWHGETQLQWRDRLYLANEKSEDDLSTDLYDSRSFSDGKVRDASGALLEASTYFKKGRCIYCYSKTRILNGQVVCRECNRVNKPMYPISILDFKPIPDKYMILLRAKNPMLYEKEVLSAAEEGRLKIAAAVSDGNYDPPLRYDIDYTESDQFIRSVDGIPIEGRFYSKPIQDEGAPVWIVQLEKKNGKKAYALLVKEKYERLAETMVSIAVDLYPVDEYEPKKRSEGF